jgi:menaquinol-cytochrome c reductase iron-sulfur subunit
MTSHHPDPPTRRSFLHWAVEGLGAIFALIFGAPVVAYLIDPRNRPAAGDDFRPVAGLSPSDLRVNRPVQGVIRNVRRDSWVLYPDDVIGRVWINRKVDGNNDAASFEIFSTKCPHLGCAIDCPDPTAEFAFVCPCHDGQFKLDGDRRPNGPGYANPADRDMFAQEFRIVNNRFEVKYIVPKA